jgi:hypothetical protein
MNRGKLTIKKHMNIQCTVDFTRLVNAIDATNFAVMNALSSVKDGPQQIGLILACQQLHTVHVEAAASALGILTAKIDAAAAAKKE